MRVNVVRHLAFEDIGSLQAVFDRRGDEVVYHEAGMDTLPEAIFTGDGLLIVLGGPISVNDAADFAFLDQEKRLLSARLRRDQATLGICLGAQLMAVALGAPVYPGPQKEIGWYPLDVLPAGEAVGLHHLDRRRTMMLHWHGETFDLPDGAIRLASSERFRNQAFSVGRKCLALQFHPEVTAAGLERWYIGHIGEIAQTAGVTVRGLREDSRRYARTLEEQAGHFWQQWLDRLRD